MTVEQLAAQLADYLEAAKALREGPQIALALKQIEEGRARLLGVKDVDLQSLPQAQFLSLSERITKALKAFGGEAHAMPGAFPQKAHQAAQYAASRPAVAEATRIAGEVFFLCRLLTGVPLPPEDQRLVDAMVAPLTERVQAEVEALEALKKAYANATAELRTATAQTQNELKALSKAIEERGVQFTRAHVDINGLRRDIESGKAETNAGLTEARKMLADARKTIDELVASEQPKLEAIRNLATDTLGLTGIASHQVIFDKQATDHRRAQVKWLAGAATAVTAALSWLAFGPLYVGPLFKNGSGQWWPPAAYFVYAFSTSILFGIAIYCARVFRAERHNMVTNEHRRNALRAYKAIIDGVGSDSGTRDAILLEVTKTIFSQQPTGHHSGSTATDGVPIGIVAILSEALKATKGKGE